MGIFNSLVATANTMNAFERSLSTVQNNVANASTPGFARQRQDLEALRFDPDIGITGGVKAGAITNYRSQFAEQSVRDANQQFGKYDQLASDLSGVEPLFAVGENAGVPGAINRFFQAASQATVSPNDTASRQLVLDRAQEVATNFNQLSQGLEDARTNVDAQLRRNVNRVNEIAGQLAEINSKRQPGGGDQGLEAKASTLLEELSGLVNYQSVEQDDGSTALYAAGSLLLIGDHSYPLTLDSSAGQRVVRDGLGNDITSNLTGGRVSALLQSYNQDIPQFQTSLDNHARDFADQVNTVLDAGVDQFGTHPVTQLFSYEEPSVASSLKLNSLTTEHLAFAATDAPGGNGNAITLAGLSSRKDANGNTFAQSYGNLTADVGRKLKTSQDSADIRGQIYAQAKAVRQETQGVSLNEEAAQLIQAQRAYQAAAQVFKTLNDITEMAINLGR